MTNSCGGFCKERKENGDIDSIEDVIFRVAYRSIKENVKNTKVNIRAFEGLVHSGALDQFIPDYVKNNENILSKREYLVHKFHLITENSYPKTKEELVDIVEEKGKESIISFAEGDEQRMMLMGLKRFTKYTNYPNIVGLRNEIAEKVKLEKKYCF